MFSIVMPVWNRAGEVGAAIDSVLSQTWQDFELIVVDDGSTDGTSSVVQARQDPRIRFFQRPHEGVCKARNYALSRATRPFIAYLDSDNSWDPDFLDSMRQALLDSPEGLATAYCQARFLRRDKESHELRLHCHIGKPFSFRELLRRNYIDLNSFVHARELTSIAGGFDDQLLRLNDWDLIIRLTALSPPVFVPRPMVDYRDRVAVNTITGNQKLAPAMRYIQKKYKGSSGPFVYVHDTVPQVWNDLSDSKHRNFWLHLNRKKFQIPEDRHALAYPFMLQIEPTNACNLGCPLCPVGRNELGRATEHMSLETFQGIVDDMADYLQFLLLWDWGEPFMNPQLPDMVAYATSRDIRTMTSTNAHFLENDEYLRRLFSAGLSTLIVAVDSLHDESYRTYRQKGSLSRAIKGLEKAVTLKREMNASTLINLRMVVMKQNQHEVVSLRRLARKVGVDWFNVKTLNPSCGTTDMDMTLVPDDARYQRFAYDKDGQRIRQEVPCDRPFLMANIFSNGDVVPCCYDFDSSMKIGNVKEKSFREIWNGEEMRAMRSRILDERGSLPKCEACGINFKQSRSGWFPEVLDLTEERLGRFLSDSYVPLAFTGKRQFSPNGKIWHQWMPF
ncbi:MAG: glycosyltransferase [Syntrophotaleaceae bacterium]